MVQEGAHTANLQPTVASRQRSPSSLYRQLQMATAPLQWGEDLSVWSAGTLVRHHSGGSCATGDYIKAGTGDVHHAVFTLRSLKVRAL